MSAEVLDDEELARAEALRALRVLDTPPESRYDQVVQLAESVFDVPMAAVNLVGTDRQWTKAQVGLDGLEDVPLIHSMCRYTVQQPDVLVVPDTAADERFQDNRFVREPPHIRFYAGHPLCAPGGERVGSLCLFDTHPRHLGSAQQRILRQMAGWLEKELAFHRELERAGRIQQLLMPRLPPRLHGYRLAGRCTPTHEIGGDFYDWHLVGGALQLHVADVMGKGVPAALIAASARAALRGASRFDDQQHVMARAAAVLDEQLEDTATTVHRPEAPPTGPALLGPGMHDRVGTGPGGPRPRHGSGPGPSRGHSTEAVRLSRRSALMAAVTAVLVTACTGRNTIEAIPPHHRVHALEHGVFLPHGPQDGPAFTTMVGAAPQWMLLFRDWTHETPPLDALDAVRAQGATPVLTWEPWYAAPTDTGPANASVQPPFALTRMLAGDHDHRISTWAGALASWGHDVVLRFAHEMNGDWYPWGTGVQGNTSEQYVRAWRHVHDRFAAAGATNVRWCWAPNVPASGADTDAAQLAGFFPGEDVVDVLGIDGYNWGLPDSPLSWTTPEELFGPGLDELRRLGTRLPIVVTETASAESHEPGRSKADWITQLFDYLTRQGDVRGVIWFQERKERDWRISSSPAARAAYRHAVAKLH